MMFDTIPTCTYDWIIGTCRYWVKHSCDISGIWLKCNVYTKIGGIKMNNKVGTENFKTTVDDWHG